MPTIEITTDLWYYFLIMSSQELSIGEGCGLKLDLDGVDDIAAFNSGGLHPSTLRPEAVRYIHGVGAPVTPEDLRDVMEQFSQGNSFGPGLDAGHHWIEGAGLFSVSTTDAMTPPTDSPRTFGRIAALHVLSDLWVSGVESRSMQQYLVVPDRLSGEVYGAAVESFKETCDEFGAKITGGHTRKAGQEFLLGGTATGYIKERRDINSPRVGDLIVATKALGTSVTIAANKMMQQGVALNQDPITRQAVQAAETSMTTDNHIAVMMRQRGQGVSACTDITGFGLMGHLSNLINPVGKGAVIELDQLPVIDGALDLLSAGVHTHAGDKAQIDYADRQGDMDAQLEALNNPRFHLAFLPETSGGVLATMWPNLYERLESMVKEAGQTLTVIGEVTRKSVENDDERFANITLR